MCGFRLDVTIQPLCLRDLPKGCGGWSACYPLNSEQRTASLGVLR